MPICVHCQLRLDDKQKGVREHSRKLVVGMSLGRDPSMTLNIAS